MNPIHRPFFSFLAALIVAATLTAAPEPEPAESHLHKEFTFELLRYLYRWYLDDDLFIHNPMVREATTVEIWTRPLIHGSDEEDNSVFIEVLIPIVQTRVILKKADYLIPELNIRIQNRDFRVATVDRYETLPETPSEYTKVSYDLNEVIAHLYITRNNKQFPSEEIQARLGKALREHMRAEGLSKIEGDQLLYLAPPSPVSNDLWIFWENERKIINFSSDCDYVDTYYWEHQQVSVDIYDLDNDIVISLIETPGSNAYITKDAVGRILFNCVVLGRREVISAEKIKERNEEYEQDN